MIPLPQQPKIILEEKNRGVYEIDGLYPGYGMTIGNSLRRVLLSSLEGAVITSFKLEGVNHEFSTLPGVLEDMVDLSLNLKQIRFRMHGEGPFAAKLSVKGEKEITASDIVVPSQIEVVNPEAHIATLTDKKAGITAEFEVERGRGYQASQDRRKEKVDIGMVALDASFSPVRSVNYEVENMRIGDRTDYNLLRLHIQTDGSISPRDALQKASHILSEQFSVLSGVFQEKEREVAAGAVKMRDEAGEKNGEEESYEDAAGKKKLDELNLSTRTMNALEESGIKTVGGILRKTEKKLREVEGLGDKGVTEIKKALGNLGLILKQ